MGEGSGAVVYRRSRYRWGMTALHWVFVAVGVGLTVWAVGDGGLWGLMFLPIALVSLVPAVGWPRQGLWADDEGVTVRQIVGSRRLAWADIEAIEAPPRFADEADLGIGFRRHDGSVVDAPLFAGRSDYVDGVVDDLRRRHARAAAMPGPTDPTGAASAAIGEATADATSDTEEP